MDAKLTTNEEQVLTAVALWRGPDVPTAVALARVTDYAHESGVRAAFKRLVARGYLNLQPLGNGALIVPQITDSARALLGLQRAESPLEVTVNPTGKPLKAWPVECGALTHADPCTEGVTLRDPRDYFATWDSDRDHLIIARGESMVNPGEPLDSIYPGAFVQVRAVNERDGQIVWVEHERDDAERECTLKTFHLDRSSGLVTLTPFNPAFETIVLPAKHVFVKGVVIDWLSLRSHQGHRK